MNTKFNLKEKYQILEIKGELEIRLNKSLTRLNSVDYDKEHIFKDSNYLWYGDWEGRTILALAKLQTLFDEQVLNIKEILVELNKHLNSEGYFGKLIQLSDKVNEQQFAGNSWFLRSLVALFINSNDQKYIDMINKVVNNLYLKNITMLETYPVNIDGALSINHLIGQLSKNYNNWSISSDSGCVYIALDGLADAYNLTKNKNLALYIENLIEMFYSTNISKKNFQSHAYLTGIMGVLRYFNASKNEKYLHIAVDLFQYYLTNSINAVYENKGALNKDISSEGCAVIDSFIISLELFKITKNQMYLEYFRKIYCNGLRVNQRNNGGFGCNSCVSSKSLNKLTIDKNGVEAFWCCTMRGGEGLTYLAHNHYLVEGKKITPLLYNDNTSAFFGGNVIIKQKSNYPNSGIIEFNIEKCDEEFELCIYSMENYNVKYCGEIIKDKCLIIKVEKACTIKLVLESNIKEVKKYIGLTYEYGDMVLTKKTKIDEETIIVYKDMELTRITDVSSIPIEKLLEFSEQIIY